MREHDLADAARLLGEREERVVRQKARLEKLEQRGRWDLAKDARQRADAARRCIARGRPVYCDVVLVTGPLSSLSTNRSRPKKIPPVTAAPRSGPLQSVP
jgi:hypothetical protein